MLVVKQKGSADPEMAIQQDRKITGKITDQSGAPVPGASVIVKGTTMGVSSTNDGTFTLLLPNNAKGLVFSFIGMKSQEVIIGNQTTFNIKLEEDAVQLEAVVAVGYGTQRKGELTVSVSQIKGEQFRSIPATSFKGLIGGRAAGTWTLFPLQGRLVQRSNHFVSGGPIPLILMQVHSMLLMDSQSLKNRRIFPPTVLLPKPTHYP